MKGAHQRKKRANDSAKGYFNEFHLTVMESFEELFTDLDNNVKQHIEAFQSNVDSSESAIIESDYLTDHKNDIDIEYQNLKNMHRTIEKTIDEVSDISSAIAPTTHSITNDNREVVKTIDELEENLTSFTKEGKSHDSQTKELLNYIEVTM
ncbi:MAG TPA: T7SS effector LXG polymorphic toxin, partial [Candidatus Dormibacteraeota bacterium]|nr:T7SS effector LXG polymorphic toxin [Candidatus Dormibacteraeota bacterium]